MDLAIAIKVKNSLFHIKNNLAIDFEKKNYPKISWCTVLLKSEQIKLHTAPKL